MTVSSTLARSGPFTGTGAQTAFPFAFQVFSQSDVRVVRTRQAGGLYFDYPLAQGVDYTVTTYPKQEQNPGGEVNLTQPLKTDEYLTILRQVESVQSADIPNQGGFYPEVIESALDRLTMLVQQLEEEARRTLRLSVVDTSTSLDGLLTAIKSAEQAIADARGQAEAAAQAAESSANASQTAVQQARSAKTSAEAALQQAQALVTSIQGGPVASVNGKAGPFVVLTPADLRLSPTNGTSSTTLTRDTQGQLIRVNFTLDGKAGQTVLTRNAQGQLSVVVTTYDGRKRTETLNRDVHGNLLSVAATEENA